MPSLTIIEGAVQTHFVDVAWAPGRRGEEGAGAGGGKSWSFRRQRYKLHHLFNK